MEKWTPEHVCAWMSSVDNGQLNDAAMVCRKNKINGAKPVLFDSLFDDDIPLHKPVHEEEQERESSLCRECAYHQSGQFATRA